MGQLTQNALAVRALRHVLDIGGFHRVAQLLLEIEAALVVRVVVAIVVDGADIDEADLERLGLGEGPTAEQRQGRSRPADLENITPG
ncbi:hypothetical protein D3C72_2285060 [compost metagenome]